MGGCSLGEHFDKSVGTPVGGSKAGAVALFGFTDGGVRLVRGYPDELIQTAVEGQLVTTWLI